MGELSKKVRDNIFLRMHPFQRLLISVILALVVWVFIRQKGLNQLLSLVILWDVFAFSLGIMSWAAIITSTTERIRRFASKEDGSLFYIFVLILTTTIASAVTVLLLIISKEASKGRGWEVFYLLVAVSGMLLSWVVLHTTFTFRYAHMYYDNDDDNPTAHAKGLDFPGDIKPDYLDFAYFAFVIGMTFQVSDVQITSKKIRRLALVHGLLSFGLNTFVVALTINIIAGLKG